MVDPVTAALTGIALVTKVTDHIKQGINAYKSIAEVGQEIDLLFRGEQELQQARNKKARASQFSTNTVAKEIIDHKLAQEKLQEVATMIDMRFGHGTWAGILAERNKRIQEAREAEKKAAMERRRKQHEFEETVKTILIAVVVMACMAAALLTAFTVSR